MMQTRLPRALTHNELAPSFILTAEKKLLNTDSGTGPVTFTLGQSAAIEACQTAYSPYCQSQHLFLNFFSGFDEEGVIADLLNETLDPEQPIICFDWVYVPRPADSQRPRLIKLPAASTDSFIAELGHFIQSLKTEQCEREFDQLLARFGVDAGLRDFLAEIALLPVEQLPGVSVAPIITQPGEQHPLYHCYQLDERQLFGDIRYESESGTIRTHQHLLQPGLLHLANNGTLVIKAEQLLDAPAIWDRLKAVLTAGQLHWKPLEGQTVATGFDPDPVPIDLKLLITGDRISYAELSYRDPDFPELVSIVADINPSLEINSRADFIRFGLFVRQLAARKQLLMPSESALKQLARWASRQAEDNRRVSLASRAIENLLAQSSTLAQREGALSLADSHIRAAELARRKRVALISEEHYRQIENGQVWLQLSGKTVGQVNGLTVVETAGEQFGEPARISVTVHAGEGDIVDIERKAEMAGSLHAKSLMVVSSFVHRLFAQAIHLPLSGSVVFEQSYYEIDGDSAGLATLIALLSAMSEIPVRQSVAMTGAIDQFGNVMAVGGINEKIEGLYEVAKRQQVEHTLSVLIPESNRCNLNLSDEVIQACNNGKLHLYPVSHVDQAIELATGFKAGEANSEGVYSGSTVFGAIQRRVERTHDEEKPSFFGALFRR